MSEALPPQPEVLRGSTEGGLDHVMVRVKDFEASKAFYTRTLAPLGFKPRDDFSPSALSFALGGRPTPDLWMAAAPADKAQTTTHVAFRAPSHEAVDAFHAEGLAAGATDNGKPGPRPSYGPTYYGCFLIDPSGNNIEAVCRA